MQNQFQNLGAEPFQFFSFCKVGSLKTVLSSLFKQGETKRAAALFYNQENFDEHMLVFTR